MKKLVLAAIVLGLAAWWYFGWYAKRHGRVSTRGSDLPAVRVDKSTLSEAGLELLADIEERVKALLRDKDNTKLKFEMAHDIAWDLRLLGAYESSAEWSLKMVAWCEQLTPAERQTLQSATPQRPSAKGAPFAGYWEASTCYFLMGEEAKGLKTMEEYLKKYPDDPNRRGMLDLYDFAKKHPAAHPETISHMKANPKYLK